MAFVGENMNRLLLSGCDPLDESVPRGPADRCVSQSSPRVPLQAETNEPTAHRALTIEEDDFLALFEHLGIICRHPVMETGCLRFDLL